MNNYFGLGVDAMVAHKFHTEREANPEQFTNRTVNKMKYVVYGTNASMKGFAKTFKLFCDGEEITIPDNCQV